MKTQFLIVVSLFMLCISGNCSGSQDDLVKDTLTGEMFSQSGLTVADLSNAVDNDVSTRAWHTDTSSAGAWLKIDLGKGNASAYRKTRIYALIPSGSPQGYAGKYSIQYSDNDRIYKNAVTGFVPSAPGWNEKEWKNVGSHRYWRFLLTNTPGLGSWLTELEMYKSKR